MPQFDDQIRQGLVYTPQVQPTGVRNVTAQGMPVDPIQVYTVTPLAASATNIAAAQTVSGAALTLTASTGVTSTSIGGVTYLDLGVTRGIQVVGASGATATNLTVAGLDVYLQPLTNTFSGPGSGATVNSTKGFRYVRSITAAGNTTTTVTAGTNDTLSFPYRVSQFGNVIINYNHILITSSAGFTAADATSPATALTGDGSNTAAVTVPGAGEFAPGTLSVINKATAGDGNAVTGVIVGFAADPSNLDRIYNPASTARVAFVADDPDLIFEVQADGAIAATQVGLNANLIFTNAGSTTSGLSGVELDTSAVAADASNQLTILRVADRPGRNEIGSAWTIVEVRINNHTEALGAIGI